MRRPRYAPRAIGGTDISVIRNTPARCYEYRPMKARKYDFTPEFGANAPFIEDLYARWCVDPGDVSGDWRAFFEKIDPATAAAPRASSPAPTPAGGTGAAASAAGASEPLRGVAGKIVKNMEESLGVPTATTFRMLAVRRLEENRAILNRHLGAAGLPKASFTHLIAYALVQGLKTVPQLNHAFGASADGPVRLLHDKINLGLAIDLEGKNGTRSLVVPSMKNCGPMTFKQFLLAYAEVVDKARAGKLTADDFAGTTITLTNPGTLGTSASVPRLMAGQGAIIATGAIGYPAEWAIASPTTLADLGISKVMQMTSTYDHRIIQGAESGAFLARVDALLQGADRFYEEVFAAVGCPTAPFAPPLSAPAAEPAARAAGQDAGALDRQLRVFKLIHAYRTAGARVAHLDPLAPPSHHEPELDLSAHGLGEADLGRVFLTDGVGGTASATLANIVAALRATYCGTTTAEFTHVADAGARAWLAARIEATPAAPSAVESRRILEKLSAAEALEKFLHTRYVGQKRFSVEGAETTIAVLDEVLNRAADAGVDEMVLGMAHRGRLNVLVNTFGKPCDKLFAEFEGFFDAGDSNGSGDVKYHLGARGEHKAPSGRTLRTTLACNPSHLEAVNPVVEGLARAKQDALGKDGTAKILPVLIHGEAAFAGQGVVTETLSMMRLAGYRTGGTIHIVIDNQVGYTAGPDRTRSTRFPTDIAKGLGIPVLHVNGDDPEGAVRLARLAFEWRALFGQDVVIDVVCYRRWGHNESDEPSYTQPLLYKKIAAHPTPRDVYAKALLASGRIAEGEADAITASINDELKAAIDRFRAAKPKGVGAIRTDADDPRDYAAAVQPETGFDAAKLRAVVEAATKPPEGHKVHANLARQLARRVDMADGKLGIDWGCAEAMAFGSLLMDGTAIRLGGQDCGRGTFAHRHSVIRGQEDGKDWVPLNDLGGAGYTVVDSLLSEEAALGFEYGYAVEASKSVVIWEAQFGDFCNGAQIQIDQYIAASEQKWGQTSGVVMLLPHGYDGQGPEHSSGRVERFLQLCAEGNMTVANCTTPANFFHLLRRHGATPVKRPLIVMTPKSLLKKKEATSTLAELAAGRFRPVIDDPKVGDPTAVTKIVVCTGKLWYDLDEARTAKGRNDVALLRLEQIYPFPREQLLEITARYLKAQKNIVFAQEEPKNMGAWSHVAPRFADLGWRVRYAGRPAAASPAAGSFLVHQAEQADLIARALG